MLYLCRSLGACIDGGVHCVQLGYSQGVILDGQLGG